MDQSYYNIQGYELEAVDLYDLTMTILNDKNRTIITRGGLQKATYSSESVNRNI